MQITIPHAPLAQPRQRFFILWPARGAFNSAFYSGKDPGRLLSWLKKHAFVKPMASGDDARQLKQDIRHVVGRQWTEPPVDGPVRVDVLAVFPRPKNHYGTGRNAGKLKATAPRFHSVKPDRDNVDKLVLDAMTGIVYTDDSRVCAGETIKRYVLPGEEPHIVIVITDPTQDSDWRSDDGEEESSSQASPLGRTR